MRGIMKIFLALCISMGCAYGKVVVFWQEAFPTLESQPVPQVTLRQALEGLEPEFVNLDELKKSETLRDAELLVFPYGSAFPADAWGSVLNYLQSGGNLLVIGGRPFAVPVRKEAGQFIAAPTETAYSRLI